MDKKKKLIILVCSIILLATLSGLGIFLLTNREEKPSGGELEVEEGYGDISWYDENQTEFTLSTKEELYGLARLSKSVDFDKKTIKLGADIVLNEGTVSEWTTKAPELVWNPIKGFKGIFDGQGHTISGLYMNQSDIACGMFSDTDTNCTIQDFKLVNSYLDVITDEGTGAISSNGGGTFKKIYTDALVKVSGWHVGGFMGAMQKGTTFEECWFDGQVDMNGRYGGGFIGASVKGNGVIMHCLNTGSVTSTFPGPQAATLGGFSGSIQTKVVISDSLAVGAVVSTAERPEVGGVAGVVSTGNLTASALWTSGDSAKSSIGSIISDQGGKLTGACLQLPMTEIIGYGGYQRTNLDFDKYWAVVEDSTPILQCWAENIPSVEGITRGWAPDTSWYSKTQTEFVISTPEELYGLAALSAGGENFYGRIIKLGADIVYNEGNAADYANKVPLNIWLPITGFNGNFDGQGYTISGLYCKQYEDTGFFGSTKSKCSVKNLRLVNSYFECTDEKGDQGIGGISAMGGGTFENIYTNAIVKTVGWYAGGIVGALNEGGKVSNCWFDGSVTLGMRNGGGIVGASFHYRGGEVKTKTEISHCLNTGTVYRYKDENNVSATLGGICGIVTNEFVMNDCLNVGAVSSRLQESGKRMDEIGAIIGCINSGAKATVDNCYAVDASCWNGITTTKADAAATVGICLRMAKENLTGYSSYQLTNLDFKNYWAVVLDGTPILCTFAKKVPSTVGILKGDTSWYDKNPNATEFVIDSKEDLYGFAVLSAGNNFAGKTIKLAKDITINDDKASDWAAGKNLPANIWTPIKNFAGTFDGQGHTISGLYGTASASDQMGMALFAKTANSAVVQNFSLKNTYFKTESLYGLSGVASRGNGTFKNIYTNAILDGAVTGNAGGFMGIALVGTVTVENCWFDGKITDAGQRVGGIIGNTNNQKINVSHCLNSGTIYRDCGTDISNHGFFGGILGAASGVIKMEDCLNVGSVTSDKKGDSIGSLIGQGCQEYVTMSNSYATAESCVRAIGHNFDKTSITAYMVTFEKNFLGLEAYYRTSLDFTNYWVARDGKTPALKTFVIQNEQMTLPAEKPVIIEAETGWFNTTTNSGVIDSPADLYGFLELSKEKDKFNASTVITLGADIVVNKGTVADWMKEAPRNEWTPIQNFPGTFKSVEGKLYKISGIYGVTTSTDTYGMGLFGQTKETAQISDFILENSCFANNHSKGVAAITSRGGGIYKNIYVKDDVVVTNTVADNNSESCAGGILGIAESNATVENCWFAGAVTANGKFIGGIVGSGNNKAVAIRHCLNSGTIARQGGKFDNSGLAGLCGFTAGNIVIEDCVNVGTISDKDNHLNEVGAIGGAFSGASSGIINNTWAVIGSAGKMVGVNNGKGANDGAFVASLDGEGAFVTVLNFADYWAAREGTYPALKMFIPESEWLPVPSVLPQATLPDTSWYAKAESDKTYTLMTAAELLGLGQLTSQGKGFGGWTIKLGANIDLNVGLASDWANNQNLPKNIWTPIGNATMANFNGTFDGQGNTVSGIYCKQGNLDTGFFGVTTINGKIYNLRIENSYFESATNTQGTAAVVGRGGGEIKNVYVAANVFVKNSLQGAHRQADGNSNGGILGKAGGNIVIENCWFGGRVQATGQFNGGIVGYTNGKKVEIRHCLNSGFIGRTISGNANGGTGGLVGKTDSVLIIDDSLNVGVVSTKLFESAYDEVGAIVGAASGTANVAVTNTWWTQESCLDKANPSNANEVAGDGFGVNNAGTKNVSGCKKIAYSVLASNESTDTLDYTNYWKKVLNSYPILKSFE